MLGVVLLPAVLTLSTVARPHRQVELAADATPYGYTWSLSLWAVPALAILLWFRAHPAVRVPWGPFWRTVLGLTGLGVLLDLAFGNAFFTFPNAGAVLGLYVWGWDPGQGVWLRNIPVEEFGFYLFGIAAALLIYLWCDLHWLPRAGAPAARRGPVRLYWPGALVGVGLFLAALGYKRLSGQEGFPGYLLFLLAVAFIPASLLLPSVRAHLNWQAYSFTALAMFLISLLWEGTLAVPYGWWGYREEMMVGLYVRAWSNVPIEEPFLWLLVTFTTVVVYEAVRLSRPAPAPGR
jgi:lycopene cyclase domain-containing protein